MVQGHGLVVAQKISLGGVDDGPHGAHRAGDHVLALEVDRRQVLDSKAEPMAYRETGAMDGPRRCSPTVRRFVMAQPRDFRTAVTL